MELALDLLKGVEESHVASQQIVVGQVHDRVYLRSRNDQEFTGIATAAAVVIEQPILYHEVGCGQFLVRMLVLSIDL